MSGDDRQNHKMSCDIYGGYLGARCSCKDAPKNALMVDPVDPRADYRQFKVTAMPVDTSAPTNGVLLPSNSDDRKSIPIASGVLDYFPAALAEVAKVSKAGNDKHNPGQPLHHARGKSTDHADALIRHFLERGGWDPVMKVRHSAEMAWRALALLQEELEAAGAPMARGARK